MVSLFFRINFGAVHWVCFVKKESYQVKTMDDLCLHESNIKSIFTTLSELAKSGKRYRLIIKIWKDKRTIDQNSLSHMWYDDLAKQANARMKTNNYSMKSVKRDLKEMILSSIKIY